MVQPFLILKGGRAGASRGEKKSRKAIQKLGLKQITGITRVSLKKSKTVLFAISNPEVYKSPTSETYVIFGEAKSEDLGAQKAAQAADQFRVPDKKAGASVAAPAAATASSVEDIDEGDLDEKDIELVMNQASSTRAAAVAALKKNDKDIVNSIMELTMA